MSAKSIEKNLTNQANIAALKRSIQELYAILNAYEARQRVTDDRMAVMRAELDALKRTGGAAARLVQRS